MLHMHTSHRPTDISYRPNKVERYKTKNNTYLSTSILKNFIPQKVSRIDHEQKKDKTEKATGLGRRTKGEFKKKKVELFEKSYLTWDSR